jgi:hypothetical protein
MVEKLLSVRFDPKFGYVNFNIDPEKAFEFNMTDMTEHLRTFHDMWDKANFTMNVGPLPTRIKVPCCAQFIVHRDRIRKHPLHFYKSMLNWVETTEWDTFWSSRAFEYAWHIVFGEDSFYQPPATCDMFHCKDGKLRATL